MEAIQNGIFTTCFCDVFSLVTITLQYLEHPWVIKILPLVFLRNMVSPFSSLTSYLETCPAAVWLCVAWQNMGRYLERFSPPKLWNFTPETAWDPDELLEWLGGRGEDALAILEMRNLLHSAGAWPAPTKLLLNTVQHPQGEERFSGFENMPTDTTVKPETQPSTMSVLPIIEIMESEVNSFNKEEASPKREQEN